jgi:hypothetical protein
MKFDINPFSNLQSQAVPAPTSSYSTHKWKTKPSSGNDLSYLFNIVENRRKQALLRVKSSVQEKVTPKFSLKTLGHVAIIAKRLTQIACDVGIARENHFIAKEKVKETILAFTAFIEKISNELNHIQSDIKVKREQKKKLTTYLKKASKVIENKLLQRQENNLKQISDQLVALEKKENSLKEDIEVVRVRISELKTDLEAFEKLENKAKPRENTPSSSFPTEPPHSLRNESPPLFPQPVGAMIDSTQSSSTSFQPIEPVLPEETSPTNSSSSSIEIKTTPSISKDLQKQLAAYLVKVDQAPKVKLLTMKKELAKEAEELSNQMDFFIYMNQIVNNPTSKKAFEGISTQNIKATPMFTQLQKKIQREVGTYPKGFDKSLIKSREEIQKNLQKYATSRGLDLNKLETLFYEVANATEKTRVAKTKELTSYMLSK